MANLEMEPWQVRVIEEKKELDEKLKRLVAFRGGRLERSPAFLHLDKDERCRLTRQMLIMQDYSDVLEDRIAVFGAFLGAL